MFRNCTVSSHLACGDALLALTEDVARNEIDPAHEEYNDSRSDHDSPEGQTERLLACGGLVQVAEHVNSEYDHGESKGDEAVCWTQ